MYRSGTSDGSTPKNPGGATPATVNGMLSISMACPGALADAAESPLGEGVAHHRHGEAPGRSSSGMVNRPAAGGTPSPEKNSPDTYSTLAISACP